MYRRGGKRLLDVVGAVAALPVAAVLGVPVAVAIKLEDGGPVLYRSPRLGRDREPFELLKFRSMRIDAPDLRNADGSTYNAEDDPRVTRVGRFIRRTSLDELPQLINVLSGEMSLVGPRPSPLGNEDRYPPEYLQKFSVRPGLTGYHQALLRNAGTMDQRIRLDLHYVDQHSLYGDLVILALTVRSVLGRRNIHRQGIHREDVHRETVHRHG